MWYGKMAGHTIEDIIEHNVEYFIWMVKAFQDVTVSQAKFFRDKWGMDLPEEVIKNVPPYTYNKKAPKGEYESLCKGLISISDTYTVKNQKEVIQSKGVPQVTSSIPPSVSPTLDSPTKLHSPNKIQPSFKVIPPPKGSRDTEEYKQWFFRVYGMNRDILPNYDFYNQKDPYC